MEKLDKGKTDNEEPDKKGTGRDFVSKDRTGEAGAAKKLDFKVPSNLAEKPFEPEVTKFAFFILIFLLVLHLFRFKLKAVITAFFKYLIALMDKKQLID